MLKETSSTSSTEGLATYKSERTFPSFLRSQTKSPPKFRKPREGLSRESFKVIRRLGEGKFGSVYLAREVWSGLIVGLKVIEKKRILRDNFLVQFVRELKIQSFLEHPNIIRVYGNFCDEEHFYIIMELGCDGQLFDIISGGQTLSEETTSFVIGNLLDAVALMHRHKILHRDIKPENIVLVHVPPRAFRATSSSATSAGRSTRRRSSAAPSAAPRSTSRPNCSRAPGTTRRWTCGP